MTTTEAAALLTRIDRVDRLLRNGRDIGAIQAIELLGEVRAFIEGAGEDAERYRTMLENLETLVLRTEKGSTLTLTAAKRGTEFTRRGTDATLDGLRAPIDAARAAAKPKGVSDDR